MRCRYESQYCFDCVAEALRRLAVQVDPPPPPPTPNLLRSLPVAYFLADALRCTKKSEFSRFDVEDLPAGLFLFLCHSDGEKEAII